MRFWLTFRIYRMQYMYIENQFVREWRESHPHRLAPSSEVRKFFEYLDNLHWSGSRLDWSRLSSLHIPFGEGDPQPSWVDNFTNTPIGNHRHLLVAYAPNQDALIARTGELLADIDLLYAGSPGPRYFCGAEIVNERLHLAVEDFAEFSESGVLVHIPAPARDTVTPDRNNPRT